MQLQVEPRAGEPPPIVATVDYASRRGLVLLLLKNVGLVLLTLSIYRFWARTALRRHFWGNISIAGDRLEYTGRGIELFIGFLIAVAILAPLGFAYNQVQLMLSGDPTSAIAVWAAYVLVLIALSHIARYRARRYRLSRTRWRGIRLGQDGSTLAYLGRAMVWSLIQILTLTLATPWKRAALRGYIVRHSWFGDRKFDFAPHPARLFFRWLAVAVLGFGFLLAFWLSNREALTAYAQQVSAFLAQGSRGRQPQLPALAHAWLLFIGPLAWAVALIVYRVAETRMFIAASSIGAVRLRSTLSSGRVLLIVVVFAVLLLIASGIGGFLAFAIMRGLLLGSANRALLQLAPLAATLVLLGFIALIYYVAMNAMVRATILRWFCESLQVENLAALEDVRQSPTTAPRRGEGLADSFEFGG
jgi:uncharacterized membrane protein YjgN (DUF898 family)